MSGQQIGTVVGGVIGGVIGGPVGAQIGMAIGGAVGGYVDPTKIQGPRLQDATTQTSRDGIPIPWGYGTFPTMGNIIWQGPLVEVATKDDGKGSGTEITNYTYTRSYAIGICEGPITGLLQAKRNGKVVYDARTDAALTAAGYTTAQMGEARANNAKFLAKCKVYLGGETQLPDPTIEAKEGVGNVGPNRGLAYVVVAADDVTELGGAIPQYEFVVGACGTIASSGRGWWLTFSGTTGTNSEVWSSTDPMVWSNQTTRSPNVDPVYGLHRTATTMVAYSGAQAEVASDLDFTGGIATTLVTPTYPGSGLTARLVNVSGVLFTLGQTNYSMSANGGLTFTDHASPGGRSLGAVARLAGGRWIAFGEPSSDFGAFYYSDQALPTAWTLATNASTAASPENGLFSYGAGAFHIGNLGAVRRTVDGAAWDYTAGLVPVTYGDADIYGATDGAGTWVLSAKENRQVVRSTDNGFTWALIAMPGGAVADTDAKIKYGNGAFVATFASKAYVSKSGGANGSWVEATLPVTGMGGSPKVEYSEASVFTGTELPDAPGYYADAGGTVSGPGVSVINLCHPALSAIVADILQREGLLAADYDVSQLTDLVDGYRIANEGGADMMIQPLMAAYRFDVAEWDGKLRFVKRGGASVLSLGMDDIAERDGDAIEQRRVQEAELLRLVTVGYLDPAAAYTATTQKWERRVGTVQAKGEASVEIPVVMPANDAARVADMRGKVAWSETETFKYSLPYRRSALTPTDVITLTDRKGKAHRVRLMGAEDDSGVRLIEAMLDRQAAYTSAVTGLAPAAPVITTPGLIGPTTLHVMDLPIWSGDADDELGVYLAASGVLSGWRGAQVDVSSDSGASYTTAAQITTGATIGYTTTALVSDVSGEYPSGQSVTVYLPTAPASVDYATLLRYANRAALKNNAGAWEIVQYQTVTVVNATTFTLSGLLRGRHATTPGAVASGAAFVLLDAAVQFLRAEQWMYGQTLTLRATSYGTLPENNGTQAFAFTLGASQKEWPVHGVTATRDGSNNVAVTWIGRARLGPETVPHASKYFTGYRVTYSDGQTYDTTASTHTRSAAPASQTITVAPINSITGAGPASIGITV